MTEIAMNAAGDNYQRGLEKPALAVGDCLAHES